MRRFVLSVVILACATAFAPAPLPRAKRTPQGEEISVESFQGLWRVIKGVRTSSSGDHQPHFEGLTHVRIQGDRWRFVRGNNAFGNHTISIDGSNKPAHLDFNRGGQGKGLGGSPGHGIIRRKGDVVEIIYIFGGRERATSFEQPPDGQYWLTL